MIVRAISRPLLASTFIAEGIETLRNPAARVEAAAPVIDLISEAARPLAQKAAERTADTVSQATRTVESAAGAVTGTADDLAARAVMTAEPVGEAASTANDGVAAAAGAVADTAGALRANVRGVAAGQPLPFQAESYVRFNAGIQVGAGLLLATGRAPRLASAALAVSLVPTTVANHRFWELEPGEERRRQRAHLVKNASLLGGLLLASADTAGRPGLAWRARHLGQESAVAAGAARVNAALAAQAAGANTRAARRLARANAKVAGKAGALGVERAGAAAARQGRRAAAVARREANVAAALAAKEAEVARRLARRGWQTTQVRAEELRPQAQDRAVELGRHAQALGAKVAERLPTAALTT